MDRKGRIFKLGIHFIEIGGMIILQEGPDMPPVRGGKAKKEKPWLLFFC